MKDLVEFGEGLADLKHVLLSQMLFLEGGGDRKVDFDVEPRLHIFIMLLIDEQAYLLSLLKERYGELRV